MFDVLQWLMAGFLSIIVLAMTMPVKFQLRWRSHPTSHFEVRARIIAGMAPPLVTRSGNRNQTTSTEDTRKRARSPVKHRRTRRLRILRAVRAAPDLIAGLVGPLRVESVTADATFGLGDPAETGQLYGILFPLIHSAAALPHTSICVRPDFSRHTLSGDVAATFRLVPLVLVVPLAAFAWQVFGPQR